MKKNTNVYQCPQSCYEQSLLEKQSKPKNSETKEKPRFTFIKKFLIILAILGFLAILAIASLYYLGRCDAPGARARTSATSTQLANIDSIIGQYLLDMRQYPKMLEELIENKNNSPNWNGPYLKKSQLKDPWGNSYQYRYPGNHHDYELYSYGADAQPGGEGDNADIKNWEPIK
ncbi:general secretion pathway protein G [Beggiatoa sp. PS]|nr:general secretion pathway protein G [Beggiatoa sp. PS]